MTNHSQIFDHTGHLLAECCGEESLLLADIDPQAARACRETAWDAWAQYRVRRPELYAPITARD